MSLPQKCLENYFNCACLRFQLKKFLGTDTLKQAEFKSKTFLLPGPAVFSQNSIFSSKNFTTFFYVQLWLLKNFENRAYFNIINKQSVICLRNRNAPALFLISSILDLTAHAIFF